MTLTIKGEETSKKAELTDLTSIIQATCSSVEAGANGKMKVESTEGGEGSTSLLFSFYHISVLLLHSLPPHFIPVGHLELDLEITV